jgi:hypothetical protein
MTYIAFIIHSAQVMSGWCFTDEWIQKMWYLYTMEFYSGMKKNEILSFASKWMELENIILSKVSCSEDQKLYVLPHMWTLDLGEMQQCCWTWDTH